MELRRGFSPSVSGDAADSSLKAVACCLHPATSRRESFGFVRRAAETRRAGLRCDSSGGAKGYEERRYEKIMAGDRTEYMRAWKAARVAAGLCVICGQPNSEPRYKRCPTCRANAAAWAAAHMDDAQIERRNAYSRAYRARRREAGLCQWCGQPSATAVCRSCREQAKAREQARTEQGDAADRLLYAFFYGTHEELRSAVLDAAKEIKGRK